MATLRKLESKDQNQVTRLLFQLSNKPVIVDVEQLIEDTGCNCVVIEDEGVIVGFASLIEYMTPYNGRVARIEDVVVDENVRGRGYGRMIMDELIRIAKEKNVAHVELTSNPARTAARALYESMGFIKKETDTFRLVI